MRGKAAALSLLAAVSFLGPMTERIATGTVEDFSAYAAVETLVQLVLIFTWYHLDKAERSYPAGKLMNAAILVVAMIAIPVYLVRSRGWQQGTLAIAVATVFVGALYVLERLGEQFGAALSP